MAATTPPGRVTRAISAIPACGSAMRCTASWAAVQSKAPSGHGSFSATPERTSTPGTRSRTAATNESDGSIALTRAGPTTAASTRVSAPGPHPTSRTRWPGTRPSQAANCPASGSENRPMNRSYASAGTSKDTNPTLTEPSLLVRHDLVARYDAAGA